jgi:hypothetical protein
MGIKLGTAWNVREIQRFDVYLIWVIAVENVAKGDRLKVVQDLDHQFT